MEIHIESINDILHLHIRGELDANSSIELDEVLKNAIAQRTIKIMVNCRELRYISSAGMGVFLSHLDDIRNLGGRFVFYNMSVGVFSTFELLGLHNMIDIVNEEIEAQKKFDES
ncbi:MAG: hypothetical protein KatS3mg031_1614 [Chitinophagales bacterium]|nr:MAG: hypothetical protein KatS3mg031_1614 [Chitinophagales bacterium]